MPGKGWFGYFRFHAATEVYFAKRWPLPDFEKVEGAIELVWASRATLSTARQNHLESRQCIERIEQLFRS